MALTLQAKDHSVYADRQLFQKQRYALTFAPACTVLASQDVQASSGYQVAFVEGNLCQQALMPAVASDALTIACWPSNGPDTTPPERSLCSSFKCKDSAGNSTVGHPPSWSSGTDTFVAFELPLTAAPSLCSLPLPLPHFPPTTPRSLPPCVCVHAK